jgi:hypothetical protein
MLSSPKRGPWKYQPAQLVPSGHGPNEVEGRRRQSGVQIFGSSQLIGAFHAVQLTGRALRISGHSRLNPELTPNRSPNGVRR